MLRYPTPQSVEFAPNYSQDEKGFHAAPSIGYGMEHLLSRSQAWENVDGFVQAVNDRLGQVAAADEDNSCHLIFVQLHCTTREQLQMALNILTKAGIE